MIGGPHCSMKETSVRPRSNATFSEGGFEFHNSFLRAHCGVWLLAGRVLMRVCVRDVPAFIFTVPTACFSVLASPRGQNERLEVEWNLSRSLKCLVRPLWKHTHTFPIHADTHFETHCGRTCTNSALSHLRAHTHPPLSHLVGVWSSIKLRLPLCLFLRLFWGTEPSTRSVHVDIWLPNPARSSTSHMRALLRLFWTQTHHSCLKEMPKSM